MKAQNHLPLLIPFIFAATGCSSGPIKPYAQNVFNRYAKLSNNPLPSTGSDKVSDSTTFRAANLGLAAASRPIPGAMPYGANVGIAAASLLLGGSGRNSQANFPINSNYLSVNMPATEAINETEAKLKMSTLIEKAVLQALHPDYQAKIEEYTDNFAFSSVRPKWIRVDGPLCENWSCQIFGPIFTEQSGNWEGDMYTGISDGKKVYRYTLPTNESIGFVKILKEYDKASLFGGSYRVVEGTELLDFDYKQFYMRISENLPDWITLHVNQRNINPYQFVKGVESTDLLN